MHPQSLNIVGSTQPEVFQRAVDAIKQAIQANPVTFWQRALSMDGPIEIWEINGERFLYNGNHRYFAALGLGVEIPDAMVKIVHKTGSPIPTFPFSTITWLPGWK